jgi:uncharacterized membrane protein SirB2
MLAEHYLLIKTIHMGSALTSISLFAGRGLWMFWRPQDLRRRWIRVLPHVVDTVLLASAILLAVVTWQYPGKDAWLTAKVAGLVVYIVLGTIALKRGRTQGIRAIAFVAALLTFAYIVAVAVTRQPWPFGLL